MSPEWLKDTVFYEIYPQSFQDSNGDGVGDLPGIIRRLDYICGLGCNALWINPCFDSPFKDAGYDVRDYKKVAPRYGTNEDPGTRPTSIRGSKHPPGRRKTNIPAGISGPGARSRASRGNRISPA